MRTPCCHTFLAFILKFLNFLQTFIGVSMIIYSGYMLDQWHRHHGDVSFPLPLAAVSFNHNVLGLDFRSLPETWFIYGFMGVGILICCITCIGHFAAEAINGCCLCFKLPFDPTGELESVCAFIKSNMDVFEWVGIAVVVIQVLSILFAIIIRSSVSSQRDDDDIEIDYDRRSRTREPLLHSYSGKASGSTRGDSDIWSSRMREKYGLHGGEAKPSLLNHNSSTDSRQ
ncbi:tetraspanin-18-like isoform X2 [Primulina huaijiensis]|uniref:tetraspanin-18-like isoform X2 n=1 Tax=Primulina huaijiensis TaxID=1492673 RepID=UPI003CC76963